MQFGPDSTQEKGRYGATLEFLGRLSFGFRRELPLVLQTETAECGLACLAMVLGFFGRHVTLNDLRNRFTISARGATLAQIMHFAAQLRMTARPLRVDLEGLRFLRLPCVLHWHHMHFVVLKSVRRNAVSIHDPAYGTATIPMDKVSELFTGVALELWPDEGFQRADKSPPITLRQLVGHISGLFGALWRVLALALALEVMMALVPVVTQLIIDNAVVAADLSLLNTLALAAGILLILQVLLRGARAWAMVYLGTTFNMQWRNNVFAHLMQLPVSYFEKRHLGDLASRFSSIDQIQRTATTSFIESSLDGLLVVVTLLVMILYSPSMTAVAVAAALAYLLLRMLTYSPLYLASRLEVYFQAKQESYFLESARGIKALKLFGSEGTRRITWLAALVDYYNANIRVQRLELLFDALRMLLSNSGKLLVLWLGARAVIAGSLSLGALVAFLAYMAQFDDRLIKLVDNVLKLRVLRVHADRLADIVLTPPERPAGEPGEDLQRELEPSIEVRDLHFRFAQGEPDVIRNLSFRVDAGESVAIVGPSGAGKTTLVNILMGVLQPTEGAVFVGGVDLKRVSVSSLRRMVGVVMQDDVLFAGTIAENISFFQANPDLGWLQECARLAAIHDDITRMPMGYHSYIGDMGTVLSGGQKQRVLLARALYKRPSILILDEATSHLDVRREGEVNSMIKALKLTRIIVAHRPETIASADRQVVLFGAFAAGESRGSGLG